MIITYTIERTILFDSWVLDNISHRKNQVQLEKMNGHRIL